jgi:hypothetical protein
MQRGGIEMEIDGTQFNHGVLSDEKAKEIENDKDDRGMILHPVMWPKWPYLPVKRWVNKRTKYGEQRELECGIMFTGTGFNIYQVRQRG